MIFKRKLMADALFDTVLGPARDKAADDGRR